MTAYWFTQAKQGNEQALSLVWAMLTETLERRFDRAFGIEQSEDDRDQRLIDRQIAQLEQDLSAAFEEADIALSRERLLEQQLRDLGVEPWALPQEAN